MTHSLQFRRPSSQRLPHQFFLGINRINKTNSWGSLVSLDISCVVIICLAIPGPTRRASLMFAPPNREWFPGQPRAVRILHYQNRFWYHSSWKSHNRRPGQNRLFSSNSRMGKVSSFTENIISFLPKASPSAFVQCTHFSISLRQQKTFALLLGKESDISLRPGSLRQSLVSSSRTCEFNSAFSAFFTKLIVITT